MKFKSEIVTQASGSIGGTTYSHNKGGMYRRSRAIPTNPNSPLQQAVRGSFADLSVAWAQTLTEEQRLVWQGYANNVPLIGKLGDPINVTGLNMFIRSNTPRLQASLPQVDTGPIIYNLASFTNPSFGTTPASDQVDVTFETTDDWVDEDDAAMLVWVAQPQSPTINYHKGPYRFAGTILGDSTTAPTSPAAIASPYPINAGQRVFVIVRVTRADGRLSYPFRGFSDAA